MVMQMSEATTQSMRGPRVEKVVVNMSIGRGGTELEHAESILESITGQQPVRTEAKRTIPAFDLRQGVPIGAKVTLRGDRAEAFLETALELVTLSPRQFDETGNVSFGISEHTDFPGQEYDPMIGLYGMDVTINLTRPGYRVAKRDRGTQSIPEQHRLTPSEAASYLEDRFSVEVANE